MLSQSSYRSVVDLFVEMYNFPYYTSSHCCSRKLFNELIVYIRCFLFSYFSLSLTHSIDDVTIFYLNFYVILLGIMSEVATDQSPVIKPQSNDQNGTE